MDKKKWGYVFIVVIVVLVGILLNNKENSNNIDGVNSKGTNISNTDISIANNVEVEKINVDINDFKYNTLPNDCIEYSFFGAIDNNLYGIGRGFSGDGLKEKVIFYENKFDDGIFTIVTENEYYDIIVDTNSIHSMGNNIYSYVEYYGDSINLIGSFDFNNNQGTTLKETETNNEFIIYDAYVCNDDIYEFSHFKDGTDMISSEKKGILQSYNAMENNVCAFSDGDNLYYSMSNKNDNTHKLYEDDVLIIDEFTWSVGTETVEYDDVTSISKYENYFAFESGDNLLINNVEDNTGFGVNDVTSYCFYDNKLYYISNGYILYYDLDELVSSDGTAYEIEKLVSLDKDLYKIVGIDDDKVILQYTDENTSLQGLAMYSKDDNKLYKYSGLEGEVEVFYNENYIIVVQKDLDNNQLNKFVVEI